MNCPNCGKEITAPSEHCPYCGGTAIGAARRSTQSKTGWFRQPEDTELENTTRTDRRDIADTEEHIDWSAEKEIAGEPKARPTQGRRFRRMEIIRARKRRKAIGGAIVFAAVLAAMVLFFVLNRRAVDEPCDWCKKRPSVAFEVSNGSKAYVCRDCMKKCMLCEKKRATNTMRHYENYYGRIVFVCEDCYREVSRE